MVAILAWSAWSVSFLMVVEYLTHRYPMHRPTLPIFRGTLHRHAVVHHRQGRSDANVDNPVWWGLLITSPVTVLMLSVGAKGPAAQFVATVSVYCLLWTGLHRSFHDVGGRWSRHLPFYRALKRHHLLHHRCPNRNFGAVFGPLIDRLNKTHVKGRHYFGA